MGRRYIPVNVVGAGAYLYWRQEGRARRVRYETDVF